MCPSAASMDRIAKTQDYPDFLHAALARSAYAAIFTEGPTRLLESTNLHRKSGCVLG